MSVEFVMWPDVPGDVFAPSAAAGLVGQATALVREDGRRLPAKIVAAEWVGDGSIRVTVERVDATRAG